MNQSLTSCYTTNEISIGLGCAIMCLYPLSLTKQTLKFKQCREKKIAQLRLYLLLKLVKYKLYDDVIFKSQNLCHSLSDPGLDDLQVDFGHVHLRESEIQNKHITSST